MIELFPEKTPDNPLVSIILGVYNGEKTILRAVHSVLNQTYPHFELIVVDDGSTDRTPQLLRAVKDSRLRIISQNNQGVAMARNLAFSESRGEYIAFIDADDIWFPTKIEVDINTVRQNRQPVCMVYSWYYAVDERNRLINLSPAYTDAGNIFKTVLLKENVLIPSTTLIHRTIYESVGGFPKIWFHEDWFFSVKASKRFPAFPTKQRLVLYQQTLDGKARRTLRDFDSAVHAYLSEVPDLQEELSPEEIKKVGERRRRALFYSFLIYNFTESAKRVYQNINPQDLYKDTKGKLALLTMATHINFLYLARVCYQFTTKYLLYPWWQAKVKWVDSLPSA